MGLNYAQAIAAATALDEADAAAAEELFARMRDMASEGTKPNETASRNECPNQQRKRKNDDESESQSAKRVSCSPSTPREETSRVDEESNQKDYLSNNETPSRSTEAIDSNGEEEDPDMREMFCGETPSDPNGAESEPSINANIQHQAAMPNSNETLPRKLNEIPCHSINATNETTESLWTCRHCHHVHSSFKFRCASCTRYNLGNDVSNDEEQKDDNRTKSPRLESNEPGANSRGEDQLLLENGDANSKQADDGSGETKNEWECPHCAFVNKWSKKMCRMCKCKRKSESSKYNAGASSKQNGAANGDGGETKDQIWKCPQCPFANKSSKKTCEMCTYNTQHKSNAEEPSTGNAGKKQKKKRGTKTNKQNVVVPLISYTAEPDESCDEFEFASSKLSDKGRPHAEGRRKVTKKKRTLESISEDTAIKQPPVGAVLSKTDLKPLFEIDDPVYAPWWPDDKRKSQPAWYLGKITGYATSKPDGKYGPTRDYSVRFDDDNEELTDIQDEYVFSREDYELTQRDGGRNKWIGVKNVTDVGSGDSWAKIVGWYEVKIDGETYNFSRLLDALKAYDAHAIARNGRKTALNLPEKHFDVTNNSSFIYQESRERDLALKYTGVWFDKTKKKFKTYIRIKQSQHHLGSYTLAADAALAFDKCSHQLGLTKRNFPSLSEYSIARKEESDERDVDVLRSEVVAYMNSMVNKAVLADAKVVEVRCDSDERGNGKHSYDSEVDDANKEALGKQAKDYSSTYNGVSCNNREKKFKATIHSKKSDYYLGYYALAADAAFAYDKFSQQLGLTSRKRNFTSLSEYSVARKPESEERGVNVPHSEVVAYMNAMTNKAVLADAKDERKQRKPVTIDRSPNSISHADERRQKDKTYHSNYSGVSIDMSTGKYEAFIRQGGKKRYLGYYALAADAALASDVCMEQLELPSSSNFANEAEYNIARAWESRERRINVPYVDIKEYLESKVNQIVSKINSQDHSNDASPAVTDINELASLAHEEVVVSVAKVAADNNVQTSGVGDNDKTFGVTANRLDNDEKMTGNTRLIIPTPKTESECDDVKPVIRAFGIDKSKLIQLTPDQCKNLRFPMGCPVWWSSDTKTDAGRSIMNEGKVNSIYFDAFSRDLLYEIAPKQQSATVITAESELAFAPTCPISVSPYPNLNKSEQDGTSRFNGTVLLSKKLDLDKDWIYTVTIENELGIQVVDSVPSSNVTYRP